MKFIDLSGIVDQPTIDIYESLVSSVDELGLECVVVGATARDLVLERGYNIPTTRATIDIDLGLEVSNWKQFQGVKRKLLSSGKFTESTQVQRLMYNDTHPIDILPFGGSITDELENIEWPPNYNIQMCVAGFREALDSSITVRLRTQPLLEIKVASLPGLALLKIIAWNDRGIGQDKDAKDIAIIIKNYGKIQANIERLYDDEQETLALEDYDTDLAGARLLGKDMARISGPGLLHTVKTILSEETVDDGRTRLAQSMSAGITRFDFDVNLDLLKRVWSGLNDMSSQ